MLRRFFSRYLPSEISMFSIFGVSALYDIILNLISVEIPFQKINTKREKETAIKWNPSQAWPKSIQTNSFTLISIAISFKTLMNIKFSLSCLFRIQLPVQDILMLFILFTNGYICVFQSVFSSFMYLTKKKSLNNKEKLLFFFFFCFHCVKRNMFLHSLLLRDWKCWMYDELSNKKNAANNLHNNYTSFLQSLQSESHTTIEYACVFASFSLNFYLCKFFGNIRLKVTNAIVNHTLFYTKKNVFPQWREKKGERMVKHCVFINWRIYFISLSSHSFILNATCDIFILPACIQSVSDF